MPHARARSPHARAAARSPGRGGCDRCADEGVDPRPLPGWYDAEQTEAAIEYVASVDRTLIADGTYFVAEADGELVACGGWSRRDKMYAGAGDAAGDGRLLDPVTEPARVRAMFVRSDWTRRGLGRRILEACEAAARAEGFSRLALGATLPGLPFYEAYGFRATEDEVVTMPNGVEWPWS